MKFTKILAFLILAACAIPALAQADSLPTYFDASFKRPKKYIIHSVEVEGAYTFDQRILKMIIGLREGQEITIPGNELKRAFEVLWKQKYFTDVKLYADSVDGEKIKLLFVLEERPRLDSVYRIIPLSKRKDKKLKEELSLERNQVLTEHLKQRVEADIIKHYAEKGYLTTKVYIKEIPDEKNKNMADLKIKVEVGPKVKINDIIISGNHEIETRKLIRQFSNTKRKRWWRLWKRSKFNKDEYEEDKDRLLAYYNSKGYRDARISFDTVYLNNSNSINIQVNVFEGHKFYFRDISFVGNTKYPTEDVGEQPGLRKILGIKRGDIYNQSALEQNLLANPSSTDISSLYMDDGYLFFQVTPVELRVENDSIDFEIRMIEGPQAIYGGITVSGNTKTSDKVILRELRTIPGQKFSRSDIQRSQRQLLALGYFAAEGMDVKVKPDYGKGTVDIEYVVEEKSTDQIEASGGFGNGTLVGTLGLTLNNFSARKLFKPSEWAPVPSGDGQRLSVRAQSNGGWFQSYNFMFSEPWFGGRKPNSFTFSASHSIQSTPSVPVSESHLKVTGITFMLGKRLKWPDDYFSVNYSLTYQYYSLKKSTINPFFFSDGFSNALSGRLILSRSSINDPSGFFPISGSDLTFSAQATPPISLINGKNMKNVTTAEKYKWLEYYKLKFDMQHYVKITKKLVLFNGFRGGFIGAYNPDIGAPPFERFYLGGSGLTGFSLDGRELIAFRGYDNNKVTPSVFLPSANSYVEKGATIFNKHTAELRYLVSSNPQAGLYVHMFFESAMSWEQTRDYNAFGLLRSAGPGFKVFLPMFGLLGLDYGCRLDNNPYEQPGANPQRCQFHFFIGQQF